MSQPSSRPTSLWHAIPIGELLSELETDPARGLPDTEVSERSAKYGLNELEESGLRGPGRILWEQFTATLVLILLAAGVVAALLGEHKDAIAIGAIVVLFGLLGFFQEYRAERAMAALTRLAVPIVRVRRAWRSRLRNGHVGAVERRGPSGGSLRLGRAVRSASVSS